jgi:serine/threonine protein kinase
MGSVYRARDLHFPNVVKLVAVKEMINMAPDPLIRQTIVQNFEREANLLATLQPSSIPRIYDYFTRGKPLLSGDWNSSRARTWKPLSVNERFPFGGTSADLGD